MKQRTRRRILIFAPLVALFVFLLWPLSSRRWDITLDEAGVSEKERVLGAQTRAGRFAPRVIVILADDLPPTDVGLYGSTWVETPNIDRIGLEGVTFTEATCNRPRSCLSRR